VRRKLEAQQQSIHATYPFAFHFERQCLSSSLLKDCHRAELVSIHLCLSVTGYSLTLAVTAAESLPD
jgi:hypothetical protein